MRRRSVKKDPTDNKVASVDKAVKSVKESAENELKPLGDLVIEWQRTLSTGSTLLDLAISSGRKRGGGVPGGILMEVYGRSGSGKTSILSELCGSAQAKGGDIMFQDPEARLDEEYSKTYGVNVPKDCYYQPNTVTEMFENFDKWKPQEVHMNVMAADSLAALSTDLEMKKGDKMGMRRAKEFSTEFRKKCRLINERQWIIACSNQVRQGDFGDVTPGGKATEFYASLRISVNQKEKLYKEKTIVWRDEEGVETSKSKAIKRAYGILSTAIVTKSSIGKPYRDVPIYIVFDYGIDNVRGNLQWLKDTLGLTQYRAIDKSYGPIDQAIAWIEKNDYEDALEQEVIDLWEEVEKKFEQNRKPKNRG